MDKNTVTKVSNSNRDVYLYEGDVDLDDYQYSIYENPKRHKDKDWANPFFPLKKPCETWPRV